MYRDTVAEVDLGAVRHNLMLIGKLLPEGVKLMAVVKADGYGHGGLACARAAERAGADQLAVAYLEEALELRAGGIKLPILILSPIHPAEAAIAIDQDLMVTVTEGEWFRRLAAECPSALRLGLKVHVKADTGLGRIGFRSKEDWLELAPWLKRDGIAVEGFYTHFATSAQADTTYMERQYARFKEMMGWSLASGVVARHYHCAGSNAALRFPQMGMDMVRIGAALFGFFPRELRPDVKLRPALRLRSRLVQVKRLVQGESLGYGNSYTAAGEEWIGTLPIGYADGWSQSLQGTDVLVNGNRARIVGKICMDQLMVRLPNRCRTGDEAVLIGSQGTEIIEAAELAAHANTVPQEISSSISVRVKRIYAEREEGLYERSESGKGARAMAAQGGF